MKLIKYGTPHAEVPGALTDRGIVPLGPLLARYGMPADLRTLLGLWRHVGALIETAVAESTTAIDPATVRIGAPIVSGANILGLGKNYPTADGGHPGVDPVLFVKSGTAVSGPHDDLVLPHGTDAVDFEIELAIVIGEGGRRIAAADAHRHIAGYTIANDVTAAGLMFPEHVANPAEMSAFRLQMLKGKSMSTFLPIGPCIVTADELGDLTGRGLETIVNGEVRQHSSLDRMLVGVDEIVAEFSQYVELAPGDVILTGTPPGIGWESNPPRWLRPGDVVQMSIDGIGAIEHRVVDAEGRQAA